MTIPAHLGPYEIERELGAGAMGVVYLARDERLDRRVALKSLPEAFADDAERLARFEREARMLAALHHPHVASLFGLEELDGRRYLVMEYVEGEDLAARIARGAVDVEEALKLADQIARGLSAAHDAGIIHRDLKPGNVLVTPAGGAKVVDFGLAKDAKAAKAAKAEEDATGADERTRMRSDDLSLGPTVMVESGAAGSGAAGDPIATEPGTLLGTAAYMSPEQARGRPLDRRTDVWSFGCVVFEMLTRRRPFAGKNLTETLAAVLQKEPDWDLLPERTPAPLRRLLARCLRKDPEERLRDLGDASLVLQEIRSGTWPAEPATPRRRHPAVVAGAAAAFFALGVLVALGTGNLPGAGPKTPTVRFTLPTPDLDWGGILSNHLAVSPDGRSWVYRNQATESLYLRRLDEDSATEIPGTEGGRNPFWSPDGHHLGYLADGSLRRLQPFEGSARTITDLGEAKLLGTPSWGPDGLVLLALLDQGIHRVPAEGGALERVFGAEAVPEASYVAWPEHLGTSGYFAFLAARGEAERLQLFVASTGEPGEEPVALGGISSRVSYAPPNRLVYSRSGVLLAQSLDLSGPRLVGDPVVVAPSIAWDDRTGAAAFDASSELLVSAYRETRSRMQFFDASDGRPLDAIDRPGDLTRPRISPAGDRIALGRADQQGGAEDLWIIDLDLGVGSRITHSAASENYLVWSPDGRRLVYYSDAGGVPDLRIRPAEGTGGETLLEGVEGVSFPTDWSPDGERILYFTFEGQDLYLISADGGTAEPWLAAPGRQASGRFSPDGRWIAFVDDDLGAREIFVAPLSDAGLRRRVSTDGGDHPAWSPSGETIYFHDDRRVLAAAFDPADGRVEGRPRPVLQLEAPDRITFLDVHPDGERLLLTLVDEELLRPATTVQMGWAAGLED